MKTLACSPNAYAALCERRTPSPDPWRPPPVSPLRRLARAVAWVVVVGVGVWLAAGVVVGAWAEGHP